MKGGLLVGVGFIVLITSIRLPILTKHTINTNNHTPITCRADLAAYGDVYYIPSFQRTLRASASVALLAVSCLASLGIMILLQARNSGYTELKYFDQS